MIKYNWSRSLKIKYSFLKFSHISSQLHYYPDLACDCHVHVHWPLTSHLRYESMIIHWCLIKCSTEFPQLSPKSPSSNQYILKYQKARKIKHFTIFSSKCLFFPAGVSWRFLYNDDSWVLLCLEFHYDVCHADNCYWLGSDINIS